MRTTSLLVLSAILLSGCASSAPPDGDTGRQPPPPPCRFCVQSPSSVNLVRGQMTQATWTITGTTVPVRVMVRNRNPQAVEVRGGSEQYAMSSGGQPNAITLDLTALSPGVFAVDVVLDERDVIAAAYRTEVRRIAEYVREQAGKPQIRREVLEVLDRTEGLLRSALPYEELTAFRDAVSEKVDELRREASALAAKERMIFLVAQRSSGQNILSELADFLIRAGDVDPLTEICVVTLPVDGATLRLYPKSAPNTEERITATRFPIYVGLYRWEIERTGYLASKGEINFLIDPERIVECTLRRSENDANVCDPVMGDLNQRCRK